MDNSPNTSDANQEANQPVSSPADNTAPVQGQTDPAAAPTSPTQTLQPLPPSQGKKPLPVPLIIILLIFTFLGGLLLAGWYYQNQLQKLQAAKTTSQAAATSASVPQTLIIGTDATAPPMESINKQGGLVGYDVDLAYRIANELGVKAEIRNITWDELFKALENKKIDMIISSVTINDERKKLYLFSEPYINAGQVIVSRKDNQIKSVDELRGKRISVQKGTTNEKEALKYSPANMVLSDESFVNAAKILSEGKADAMISDLTMAKGFINQYDNLKITSDPFTNDYYGVVFRKDETDLHKKVNDALDVLRVKGILTDLKQKWLE